MYSYFVTFVLNGIDVFEKTSLPSVDACYQFIEKLKSIIPHAKLATSSLLFDGRLFETVSKHIETTTHATVMKTEVDNATTSLTDFEIARNYFDGEQKPQVTVVEKVVEEVKQVEEPKVEVKQEVVEEKKVVEKAEEIAPVEATPAPVAEEPAPAPTPTPASAPAPVEDKSKESLSKSFEAKLYLNTSEMKEYYSEIKNEILSYKGVYSKISFKHETFKFDGKLIIKLVIRGTKPAMLCALENDDLENSKFKFIKVDEFIQHEETPLLYKFYNPLRIKNTKQIIELVMDKYRISKDPEYQETDFASKYEEKKTVDQLIEEGQIRKQ